MKKALKIIGIFIALVLLVIIVYVSYVLISFHRFGNMKLTPEGEPAEKTAQTGKTYSFVSYNIGFGAYESDYGFFMDGGTESRAWSKERLDANLKKITELLKNQNADFYFVQEVDIDSTRSYHLDERDYLNPSFENYSQVFAQNYNSSYLLYPIYCPHGASKSGIMTFSKAEITEADRVELPIETGIMKILDLDRCYSKSRVNVENGKELVLYNFHLSAYTSDGKIAEEQLKLLVADIKAEYDKGNYCIAGGDFNKDLLDGEKVFGEFDKDYTWAQPIPKEIYEDAGLTLVRPFDENNPVPSCRNADSAYHEGQFVITIDGFLVTDNIKVESAEVIDTGFAYSDHNPVRMTFELEE